MKGKYGTPMLLVRTGRKSRNRKAIRGVVDITRREYAQMSRAERLAAAKKASR